MEFGVGIFFTDYSISPAELAVALEERGFDSLWAPEHSHIPVPPSKSDEVVPILDRLADLIRKVGS